MYVWRAGAMDYVIVDGVRLGVYNEVELRSLSRLALREHAERLQRALGSRIVSLLPASCEDLISWVLSMQRLHLDLVRLGRASLTPRRSLGVLDRDTRVLNRGGLFGEGMVLAEAH